MMKSFSSTLSAIIIGSVLLSACSSQRYVSSETDDIYYSASDRKAENDNQFNQVEDVSGEDYNDGTTSSSDYFSVGKEKSVAANPNAEGAYAQSQEQGETTTVSPNGTTINNFYGSTDYYEGDYYDETYATRLRRFNNVNVGLGYSYYDPYFVDPYWNYGWSAWNPRPYSGWGVGYNTWSGWNVNYNWGWGYGSYYPYYSPYYSPYWGGGYGGYYGSPYWNGYNNGYVDGYYSGNYYGGGNNGNNGGIGSYNPRKAYNGKRPSALGGGFSENVASSSRRSSSAARQSQVAAGDKNVNSSRGSSGATARPSNNSRVSSRTSTIDKVAQSNSVYQVNDRRTASNRGVVNKNAENVASNRYSSASRSRYSSSKYDVHGSRVDVGSGSATPSHPRNINRNHPTGTSTSDNVNPRASSQQSNYSGSSRATYNTGRSSQNYSDRTSTNTSRESTSTRPSSTTTNSRGYTRPSSSNSGNVQKNNSYTRPSGTTPSRTATPSRSTTRSNTGRRSSESYSAPRSRSNSTAPSRNYSAPSNSSPSRNYSAPSGSSRSGSHSSPSRSSSPRSSSPSSSPSRSSGGRR